MAMDEVARVAVIEDRVVRLRAATEGVANAQRMMAEMSRIRRAVIQELHFEGWSFAKIGEAAGLTRARAHQGPAPEGAFFGHDRLLVLAPPEESAAAQELARLLQKLDCHHELTSLPSADHAAFETPGLILLGGPARWDNDGTPLEHDPYLRFTKIGDERAFEDLVTGEVHRAQLAAPVPRDIAYLGRIPGPDGSGMLLVVTGLHSEGTRGAVAHLTAQLASLHESAGRAAFSVLLYVDYDADGAVVESGQLTPIYLHPAPAEPAVLPKVLVESAHPGS